MNYFEWFDLPVSFATDTTALKKKYFELSKKYHPDFFSNATVVEKERVLELSTFNTNAFNVLSNFDKRLKYVLQLKNIITDEEKFNLPPDFLVEMMELNEQISEGKNIENCQKEIASIETSLHNKVKNILDAVDLETATAVDFEEVKQFYFKRKYLKRLQKLS